MRKRTRARELTLQALYQIEIQGKGALEDAVAFLNEKAQDEEISLFGTRLLRGCQDTQPDIDSKIASVAENWELPRMAVIDRCILRLAVYELLYREDIPPKVSINEAIELAKKYSTENSGTFVNGVLDKIYSRYVRRGLEDREPIELPQLSNPWEADLHIHTLCSDGTLTPEEVVEEAVRIGLGAIAITDHDSIDGVMPARLLGKQKELLVIPGIELSGYLPPGEVHILGLFIDVHDKALVEKLREMRRDRVERLGEMVERLVRLGVNLEAQEVLELAGTSPPGRMHVAEVLWKRGYCTDIQDAFNRYISDEGPAYVPKRTVSPQQAIELILGAGGIPVYTHPGLTQRDDLIPMLVESGIQAIEVYYPTHTPEMVEKYLEIARKYDLAITGGSDFHGLRKPNTPVGKVRVPGSLVVALRQRVLQRRGVPVGVQNGSGLY